MSTWGTWLTRARTRAGFASQADLARELGVSRGAVGNWESERSRPEMAHAERLAVLLRRPRSEVLAKFGYPVGGGDPVADLPPLPPEWLSAIQAQIAAGVADGVAQVLRQLQDEGLLARPAAAERRPAQRRGGGSGSGR